MAAPPADRRGTASPMRVSIKGHARPARDRAFRAFVLFGVREIRVCGLSGKSTEMSLLENSRFSGYQQFDRLAARGGDCRIQISLT